MFKKKLLPKDKVFTVDEVLMKTESFCAYRERCPKEVRARIAELGMRGNDAEQIYQSLEADGYFKESRFATAYAGGKFRMNHWGKIRIKMELRMRDIDPNIIEEALDSIDEETYLETLDLLIAKKKEHYKNDEQPRLKAAAALIRVGFEPDLVFGRL
jgi:regulatory protein